MHIYMHAAIERINEDENLCDIMVARYEKNKQSTQETHKQHKRSVHEETLAATAKHPLTALRSDANYPMR